MKRLKSEPDRHQLREVAESVGQAIAPTQRWDREHIVDRSAYLDAGSTASSASTCPMATEVGGSDQEGALGCLGSFPARPSVQFSMSDPRAGNELAGIRTTAATAMTESSPNPPNRLGRCAYERKGRLSFSGA